MSERVLNFSEFSGRYNQKPNELDADYFATTSDNFTDAFDDSTYDQPEIKPNRRVEGNYEMTPDAPAASNFSQFASDDMNAPDETQGTEDPMAEETPELVVPETEEEEAPEVEENEEEEDEAEETEEDEEEEEDDELEEGNPEAGANPKKKKVEESVFVKGFSQFVNENFDIDDVANFLKSDGANLDTCPNCGEGYEENEEGDIMCGCKSTRDCGCSSDDEHYSMGGNCRQ
jgi:hypothetical protein